MLWSAATELLWLPRINYQKQIQRSMFADIVTNVPIPLLKILESCLKTSAICFYSVNAVRCEGLNDLNRHLCLQQIL